MRQEKTLEKMYDECLAKGYVQPRLKVDVAKAKAKLRLVEEYFASAKQSKASGLLNPAYTSFYDVLHLLVEAFLMFDRISSSNHQCLFAYLCYKHSELELDWNFFERIRTRRNGINYYGEPITKEKFNEDKLGFELYIKLLKKEILKRLKE